MKKKVIATILAATIVVAFGGCGQEKTDNTVGQTAAEEAGKENGGEASDTGKSAADITVAGVVFQEDQFMMLMQKGYQAAADEYGVNCMLGNTGNDQAKEAELINTYTTQKIDGIAIAPLNETSSMQTLKVANDAGLEIAVGNTQLVDAPWVCGGYTSDNYNLGELTGKEARKFIEDKLDGKARVAILQYKSQLPDQSTDRMNGFVDQIKDLPGVEIVADQDAWLQDTAVQATSDILTANEAKGGVDIIWAANDGGTIGATMAVKNAGKAGQTFVFGTDAAEQQASFIKSDDNILQCVTGQDPYTIGYNTMETLIKAIQGDDSLEYGKGVVVPGIVLTKEDIPAVEAFEKDLAEKMGK